GGASCGAAGAPPAGMSTRGASAGGGGGSLSGKRGGREIPPQAGAHLPASLHALADRDQAAAWRGRLLSSARVGLRHPVPSRSAGGARSVPPAARAAKCRRFAGLIVRFAPQLYRLERSPHGNVQPWAPGAPALETPRVEPCPMRC